jgi:hypothetical protein
MVAALIVARWLPLFRLEQVALLSGFLMALGFSVNSTGYMPGVLLLLLWVALFRNGQRPAAEILVAGLLATIHLLFFALAIPLLILSCIRFLRRWRDYSAASRVLSVIAAAFTMGLAAFSLWLFAPNPDGGIDPPPVNEILVTRLPTMAQPLEFAAFPFARSLPQISPLTQAIAVVIVIVIVIVALSARPATTWAPILGLTLVFANNFVGYGPFWWHSGVLFFAVLSVALITRADVKASWTSKPLLWQTLSVWVLLGGQVFALATPGRTLLSLQPFSTAKEVSQILRVSCPEPCVIVTDWDFKSAALSAYLGGRDFYQVNASRFGSFTVWKSEWREKDRIIGWDEIGAALAAQGPDAVGVISSHTNAPEDFRVLLRTEGSVWWEDFLLVRLQASDPD